MSIQVQVSVSKEAFELMLGVAGFVGAVKQALKDGWQPGTDLPAILSAAIVNIVPALQGVEKIPAEVTTETPEFAKAVAVGAAEIYAAIRG